MNTTISNMLELVFPALSVNESTCRAMIGAFIAQINPTVDDLADIKCAVSEAVTNAIVHAYRRTDAVETGGLSSLIYISVTIGEDRTVRLTVRDKGCGIPDIAQARMPLYTTDPAGERSGMGFSVMESFTDRMKVSSRVGVGTRVTMYKKMK